MNEPVLSLFVSIYISHFHGSTHQTLGCSPQSTILLLPVLPYIFPALVIFLGDNFWKTRTIPQIACVPFQVSEPSASFHVNPADDPGTPLSTSSAALRSIKAMVAFAELSLLRPVTNEGYDWGQVMLSEGLYVSLQFSIHQLNLRN